MKNYNINSLNGMDDLETCNDLGLDTSLAYTPKLNNAALEKMQARNIEAERLALMAKGISADAAHKQAIKISEDYRKIAEDNLKAVQKERGY
jgi:hypothetical protein